MNTYTISNTKLNPNRVFILQKSELENSLSPLYYSTLPKKLNFSKKLKEIAFVNPLRKKPVFADDELVPYVGLPETDEHSKSIINVVLRPYKEVKGRNIIYPNELLFARIEPSIFNKKYILTKDLKGYDFAFTSTEFYIVKGKDIDNEYLLANFLSDYVYKQVEGKTTGSTGRRRLDKTVFTDLIFPFPERKDRVKVSKIISLYFEQKKQNEAEAKNLLSSIDDYLLGELGIKLPEPPENTLKNRMFTVSLKEISGGRFESEYYTTYNRNLTAVVQKSNYPKVKLIDCLNDFKKGIEPGSSEYIKEGKPFVRVSDITKFGIKYNNCAKKLSSTFYEKHKEDFNPKINEILFSKDGTLGICYLVKNKEEYILSSAFLRLITNDLINRKYLTFLLSSILYKALAERNSIGTIIKHLNTSKFLNLKIPLPPLEKQKQIANHITEIREQAQKLKDKTAEALKEASKEIEDILLN